MTILDILFPRRCPVCDRPVPVKDGPICKECRKKLIYTNEPFCMRCGKPLQGYDKSAGAANESQREFCYDCMHRFHLYDRGVCLYHYDSVRRTVYRFKYSGRKEYAVFLGQEMAVHLGKQLLAWNPDALVPVPLHSVRLKKRGYNQAALLARELGRRLEIPVAEKWLIRDKNTVPLKMMDGRKRQKSLKNAFKIVQNELKLKTIIIIDDIYTTGSTIDAIAALCRENGVERVYFAALSVGSGM